MGSNNTAAPTQEPIVSNPNPETETLANNVAGNQEFPKQVEHSPLDMNALPQGDFGGQTINGDEIKNSVGKSGQNNPDDVRLVQQKLNAAGFNIKADGVCGKKTEEAIWAFQKFSMGIKVPSGLVEPNSKTWTRLKEQDTNIDNIDDALFKEFTGDATDSKMPAIVVVLTGGDLSSGGPEGGIAPKVANNLASFAEEKEFGNTRIALLNSNYWNYLEVQQQALQFVLDNYKDGSLVMVYGYSKGGEHALSLQSALDHKKIPVHLLVTVDAADGPASGTIFREVYSNVQRNLNIYQTTPSRIYSKGDKNYPEKNSNTLIENIDMTDELFKGSAITHGNIGDASEEQVLSEMKQALLRHFQTE